MTVMMTMMSLGTLLQWLTAECKKADIKLETEFHPQFHPALIVSGEYYPYPMGITHPNPIPLIATRYHILLRRVIYLFMEKNKPWKRGPAYYTHIEL